MAMQNPGSKAFQQAENYVTLLPRCHFKVQAQRMNFLYVYCLALVGGKIISLIIDLIDGKIDL